MEDETATAGASPNERLLFAAKSDSEELFEEVVKGGGYDINHQDSLGNTALHYAVMTPSLTVLDLLLDHEGTDVDLVRPDPTGKTNKLEGDSPLHLAVKLPHPGARLGITQGLLESGANPSTKNRRSQRPVDLVASDESELRQALRQAEAAAQLGLDDVVVDDDDDDDDDEEEGGDGSGSSSLE